MKKYILEIIAGGLIIFFIGFTAGYFFAGKNIENKNKISLLKNEIAELNIKSKMAVEKLAIIREWQMFRTDSEKETQLKNQYIRIENINSEIKMKKEKLKELDCKIAIL
jgi:hypothetical protein